MRRLQSIARFGLLLTTINTFLPKSSLSEAFAGDAKVADPLIYNVPTMSSRTVGRDTEVMALWQNLLSGRRYQLLVGVDGIGKSTVASAFCECARSAPRFSCIQWFDGRYMLESQLEHFFNSMKGRKEKEVLIVLDDVQSPERVLQKIPKHNNVYMLLTSNSRMDAASSISSLKISVNSLLPLSAHAAEQFMAEVHPSHCEDMQSIYDGLGYVPLLMHVANCLVTNSFLTCSDLKCALESAQLVVDNTLSVSSALSVLLPLSIKELQRKFPQASSHLAILSCFYLNDISHVVMRAVMGDAAFEFATLACRLGIFSMKWQDGTFTIHTSIAQVLFKDVGAGVLETAVSCLKALWPRRWRGRGDQLAYTLVWHTTALAQRFVQLQQELSEDMKKCMDRSATYLAHIKSRDLPLAAELWLAVLEHEERQRKGAPATPDMARIGMECGRLLHYLRRPLAKEVLATAYSYSSQVHGGDSVECALVMGCLALYMDSNEASLAKIDDSIAVLETKLSLMEVVLSKEERKMLLETVFVLSMCKGHILKDIGKEVPESIWQTLESIETRLNKIECQAK